MSTSMAEVHANSSKAQKILTSNLKALEDKKFLPLPEKTNIDDLKKAMRKILTYFKNSMFTEVGPLPTKSHYEMSDYRVVWTNIEEQKEKILKCMPEFKVLKEYIDAYCVELSQTVIALEDYDSEKILPLLSATFLKINNGLRVLCMNLASTTTGLGTFAAAYRAKADNEFWSSEEAKCDASASRIEEVLAWAEIQMTALTIIVESSSEKAFMGSLDLVMASAKYSISSICAKNNDQLIALVKNFKGQLDKQAKMYEAALETIIDGFNKEIKALKLVLAKSQMLNKKYESNLETMISRMEKLNDTQGVKTARQEQEGLTSDAISIDTEIDNIVPAQERIRLANKKTLDTKMLVAGGITATVVVGTAAYFLTSSKKAVQAVKEEENFDKEEEMLNGRED